MPIDALNARPGDLYQKGEEVYRLIGVCHEPAIIMESIDTGQRVFGGASGLMWNDFKRLVPEK